MKFRTFKKRVRRRVKWLARHKIPRAFENGRDRKEWINYMCDYHYHIKHWKVKQ